MTYVDFDKYGEIRMTADTIHEDDPRPPKFTGLYDHAGQPLYRPAPPRVQMGFQPPSSTGPKVSRIK